MDFGVAEIIPHPNYKPPAKYNDIALIKLDKPANFTLYINPVCLEYRTTRQIILVATGWGKTSYGGETSPHLIKVGLDEYNTDECQEKYSETPKRILPNGINKDLQVCAGGRDEEKDTCQVEIFKKTK